MTCDYDDAITKAKISADSLTRNALLDYIIDLTPQINEAVNMDEINSIAQIQNEYMRRRFSTQKSLYNYEIMNLHSLQKITYALFILYFIVAAGYLGIIFLGPNREKISFSFKGSVLLFILLFPFLITPIEYFLFRCVLFMIETFAGQRFEADKYEYIMDQTYVPRFSS